MPGSRIQTIVVNGESYPYQPQSVRELLIANGINPDRAGIAVAINAAVVHREEWDSTRVQPDDRVEIVSAQAGG